MAVRFDWCLRRQRGCGVAAAIIATAADAVVAHESRTGISKSAALRISAEPSDKLALSIFKVT
ncbi:MAG: hypothetical protein WKF84_29830 [Pyrinomonadaceae bacterium]